MVLFVVLQRCSCSLRKIQRKTQNAPQSRMRFSNVASSKEIESVDYISSSSDEGRTAFAESHCKIETTTVCLVYRLR